MYLGYHSAEQVCCGAALGTVVGAAWRLLTVKILQPHVFPAVERTKLAQMLQLHDASAVPNVLHGARAAAANGRRVKAE